MGLDMYAYTVPAEVIGDAQVDIPLRQGLESLPGLDTDFAYWRKFNALHGWMETLYVSKGGADAVFNCSTVRLMSEDLEKLQEVVDNKSLTGVPGFFFGDTNVYPGDYEEVQLFINKAKRAIEEGKAVIYSSWW